MEQEIEFKQELAALIAEPEKVSPENATMLTDLAARYPYFQPVKLLLAKATLQNDGEQSNLATAALYTNGQLLHNFLHASDCLLNTNFNIVASSFANGENEPLALDEAAIDEVPAELERPITDTETDFDDEEVFDEISEVNISDYLPVDAPPIKEKDVEDDLVLENIVATDFFAFQENFNVEPVTEEEPAITPGHIEEYQEPEEEKVISKYDDDRLPYTFLWWLAKTRKEHQQIFQPYASPKREHTSQEINKPQANKPGDLQQQYVEHIFHMQSPFNEQENDYTPTHFKRPTKGDEIIESFIKNEPQISPPKPEQINNENKAKKSAEDHNDLVSETLANIYIEQMLYDKAIETYEKLSLKFPEKSRYFADLIQSIEKKI